MYKREKEPWINDDMILGNKRKKIEEENWKGTFSTSLVFSHSSRLG